jgi:long-chain acyl-CoA synthetase
MTTTLEPRTRLRTPAARLLEHAEQTPNRVALREKYQGIWREITWAEYWDQVETFAHALMAFGIEKGDRVAIQSENRAEWLYTDVGSMARGAICVGLYPTNPTAEIEYLLSNSGSRVLVCEDQEQADKVLAIPPEKLPELKHIVYIEHRGVDTVDDPRLVSWDDWMAAGREHREAYPEAVRRCLDEAEPDDIVYLIYTSGTTGPPKGAMLSLGNLVFATDLICGPGALVRPAPGPKDLLVSYLPLCHIYEKVFSVLIGIGAGATVHFGESLDTLIQDLREVQPTIMQGVPRIWERIHASTMVRLASASFLKKANSAVWLAAARYIGKVKVARNGRHSLLTRVLAFLGEIFLFRALKDRAGLRRVRTAISGAAPIAPEILEFYMGVGVPIYEAYGMTENTAIATANPPGNVKLGTVGTPYEGTEVELDPDTGEILTRHGAVFKGYWNMPEATARTLTPDGWLRTGDVGVWVDGTHLKIIDRLKDIIITSGGKNISPSEIENTLKASPYIKEAIVIGDRRKYLTALIGIDYEVVSEWAQRKGIPHTTYRDLSEKPEVVALVEKAVKETNEKFARVEQIKAFRLITKELDHEDGELTATQKVKRQIIEERFADLIADMYGEA